MLKRRRDKIWLWGSFVENEDAVAFERVGDEIA